MPAPPLYRWRGQRPGKYRQCYEALKHASAAVPAAKNWTAYSASIAERYRSQRLSRLRNSTSPDMFDDCARLDVVIARGE
ncbi:hypothetical protein FACS1894163_06340 [Spirochaetia bacterium]|nr:hypothetical protein FACS1894163_06340 [Spirochaetia bacterium]